MHAFRIPLTVELFLHRQSHHTHQSSQQNPHHHCSLLTILFNVLQVVLQTSSFSFYYIHFRWKIKQTMQGILKKCFSSVPAFLPDKIPFVRTTCNLQGQRLQERGKNGKCGRDKEPGRIKQAMGQRISRLKKNKVKSAEPYDSALKHLRGDSNPCFSLERAAS